MSMDGYVERNIRLIIPDTEDFENRCMALNLTSGGLERMEAALAKLILWNVASSHPYPDMTVSINSRDLEMMAAYRDNPDERPRFVLAAVYRGKPLRPSDFDRNLPVQLESSEDEWTFHS